MEERFHFPSMLYFDVNRQSRGTVAGSVRDGSFFFFLAVDMFLLKYRGNIWAGESSIRLSQKRKNLRGKKKIGVGQPINCQ